ncbi:hypothetical protein SARC_05264 [Sphaeroforma arctica JP610]|uniref:MYND-type domain-containing protein n=1 Tax=Sphaeroforma arctica JP610 TaxID=667725 RepID=A0A0L0G0S2_9EUKA|nr:hypothetical protein SARC_05264 [Sphaeroforma arctica JP610]KNC82449.1 hypothetical protein SARC_05264 [Sphaeroforma arctica JP610]|eukprot:XP_014156351.1 hypothetical protein SARC_05264 [Sphaeroforma arctica JP610]
MFERFSRTDWYDWGHEDACLFQSDDEEEIDDVGGNPQSAQPNTACEVTASAPLTHTQANEPKPTDTRPNEPQSIGTICEPTHTFGDSINTSTAPRNTSIQLAHDAGDQVGMPGQSEVELSGVDQSLAPLGSHSGRVLQTSIAQSNQSEPYPIHPLKLHHQSTQKPIQVNPQPVETKPLPLEVKPQAREEEPRLSASVQLPSLTDDSSIPDHPSTPDNSSTPDNFYISRPNAVSKKNGSNGSASGSVGGGAVSTCDITAAQRAQPKDTAIDLKLVKCDVCGRDSFWLCKCKGRRFCGRACQLKDWRAGHRAVCANRTKDSTTKISSNHPCHGCMAHRKVNDDNGTRAKDVVHSSKQKSAHDGTNGIQREEIHFGESASTGDRKITAVDTSLRLNHYPAQTSTVGAQSAAWMGNPGVEFPRQLKEEHLKALRVSCPVWGCRTSFKNTRNLGTHKAKFHPKRVADTLRNTINTDNKTDVPTGDATTIPNTINTEHSTVHTTNNTVDTEGNTFETVSEMPEPLAYRCDVGPTGNKTLLQCAKVKNPKNSQGYETMTSGPLLSSAVPMKALTGKPHEHNNEHCPNTGSSQPPNGVKSALASVPERTNFYRENSSNEAAVTKIHRSSIETVSVDTATTNTDMTASGVPKQVGPKAHCGLSFKCVVADCCAILADANRYRQHMRDSHWEEYRRRTPYACQEKGCDSRYTNEDKYKQHKISHAKLKLKREVTGQQTPGLTKTDDQVAARRAAEKRKDTTGPKAVTQESYSASVGAPMDRTPSEFTIVPSAVSHRASGPDNIPQRNGHASLALPSTRGAAVLKLEALQSHRIQEPTTQQGKSAIPQTQRKETIPTPSGSNARQSQSNRIAEPTRHQGKSAIPQTQRKETIPTPSGSNARQSQSNGIAEPTTQQGQSAIPQTQRKEIIPTPSGPIPPPSLSKCAALYPQNVPVPSKMPVAVSLPACLSQTVRNGPISMSTNAAERIGLSVVKSARHLGANSETRPQLLTKSMATAEVICISSDDNDVMAQSARPVPITQAPSSGERKRARTDKYSLANQDSDDNDICNTTMKSYYASRSHIG